MGWVKHEKPGAGDFYQCLEFNNQQIVQAVSTRNFGNQALHTGDDKQAVILRRHQFLNSFGLELKQLVAAVQTHGTVVRIVEQQDAGSGANDFATALPDTDALITCIPGLVLAIFTADCLPIFIYDSKTPAIGIVHAGWRGTIAGIVNLTLEKMMIAFGTKPADCMVALGPSIGGECFQVAPDLAECFAKLNPLVVKQSAEKYYVDLARYNQNLLQQAGVDTNKIILPSSCTSCQVTEFFSYRAEGGTAGRMMGIISLKDK